MVKSATVDEGYSKIPLGISVNLKRTPFFAASPSWLVVLLPLWFFGCASGPQLPIPGFGAVKWSRLCDDELTCGAQGEDTLIALRSGRAVRNLNTVESLLGAKVNPKYPWDNAHICGRGILEKEYALQAPTVRAVQEDEALQSEVEANMVAKLESSVAAALGAKLAAKLKSNIRAVSKSASVRVSAFRTATYTIRDEAVDSVRKRCGAETSESRIVYSITAVEGSGTSKSTTYDVLRREIEADLEFKSNFGEGSAKLDSVLNQVAQEIFTKSFEKLRFVIAIGFTHLPQEATDDPSLHSKFVQLESRTSLLESITPPGVVVAYTATTAPPGWLFCDGRAVSRTEFAALFDVIGTTHGHGDRATTFNLPDYQGRFLRAVDGAAGNDPDRDRRRPMAEGANSGNRVGSVQDSAFEDHTHAEGLWSGCTGGSGASGPTSVESWNPTSCQGNNVRFTGNTFGAGGGSETRPTNAYVNYMIRY